MAGRYYDLAADTEIDLDLEESEAVYLGYRRRLTDTPDSEWYGAQDPVERERKRLARHGRADWYVNNTTTRDPPVAVVSGDDVEEWM
jgi:hypothetical protein